MFDKSAGSRIDARPAWGATPPSGRAGGPHSSLAKSAEREIGACLRRILQSGPGRYVLLKVRAVAFVYPVNEHLLQGLGRHLLCLETRELWDTILYILEVAVYK